MFLNYKKKLAAILLIAALGLFYGVDAWLKGYHKSYPGGDTPFRYEIATSIVLSSLNFGIQGYKGNDALNEKFRGKLGRDFSEKKRLKTANLIDYGVAFDEGVKKANAQKKAIGDNNLHMLREDKGVIFYVLLAFKLFGQNYLSFFKLYFLLLLVGVGAFILSYQRDALWMMMPFVVFCQMIFVLEFIPHLGSHVESVINTRIMPIVSIIPTLHLALFIIGRNGNKKYTWLWLVQLVLLIFMIEFRSSGRYQLFFLFIVAFATMGSHLWLSLKRKMILLPRHAIIFLLVIFSCLFTLRLHYKHAMNFRYTAATMYHMFWHPAFIGLSAHPDNMEKYGILRDDAYPETIVRPHVKDLGEGWTFDIEKYENFLKNRYMEILRDDPWYVVMNKVYKVKMFLENWVQLNLTVIRENLILFLFLFGGVCFWSMNFVPAYLAENKKIVGLFLFGLFCFSCLPWMLYLPDPIFVMIESAILLNAFLTVLFIFIAPILMSSVNHFWKRMFYESRAKNH